LAHLKSNFLPKKFRGYLKAFLRKKLICAKKVTKLPALTVLLFCILFFKINFLNFFAIYGKYFPIFSRGIKTSFESLRICQLIENFGATDGLAKTEGLNSVLFCDFIQQ
jgi:hypothetical protein